MSNVSKSPERGSFQKESMLKADSRGKLRDERVLEYFRTERERVEELEASDAWKTDNLEHDLRTTDWILQKARTRDEYAQHIYAAMCNVEWIRLEAFPILKDQRWGCSWRHAGGIVADMLEKGDYIDWYCSGISNDYEMNNEATANLTGEQQVEYTKLKKYVPEGCVTMEIRDDFKRLGWIQAPEDRT